MAEIIVALLLVPVESLLIGWLWWRWGSFSRANGYHPRTVEAYQACITEMRSANENRRQRGLWLVTK